MRVPPTERRGLTRPRLFAIVAVVVLVALLLSLRTLSIVFTDYLWFRELGFTKTWRELLWAKAAPALTFTGLFFVFLLGNLIVADRLSPKLSVRDLRPGGQEDLVLRYRRVVGPYLGRIRVGVALAFALIAGFGVWSRWNEWVLFRNSRSFGVVDPQFHRDVGFYVFELPFWKFAYDWTFASLIIVIIVTAVAHYFNGGIRLQGATQRVTPQVKVHLSVLLALVAACRAWGYWLERYELALSTSGVVHGAGYTDLEARLPAKHLLIAISLAAIVMFVANIWLRGWALPVIAVGLWAFVSLAIGTIYPSLIQRFRVEPNEFAREEQLIERNIVATRAAYGIADIEEIPFAYRSGSLTADDLELDRSSLEKARVWDPDVILDTYDPQQIATYYRFGEVDLDRYDLGGEVQQVTLAPRELNPDRLPSRSYVNQRLVYTHGYGMVMSPSNGATSDGLPTYLVRSIPPVVDPGLDLSQPRLYFGESVGGYAIVDTDTLEFDYPQLDATGGSDDGDDASDVPGAGGTSAGGADGSTTSTIVTGVDTDDQTTQYEGSGGISLDGIVRRSAFALRLWDFRPLISDQITSESRILINRDIRARVESAAPFLEFDADAYPVLVGGGIKWIIDAYTVTDNYPFAQAIVPDGLGSGSGLSRRLNYVRNSVKAVVDAYDGSVTFYVVDESDPMVQAYVDAFPDTFSRADEVPPELAEHFRHPEDLFRIQSDIYRSYHTVDAQEFFNRSDQWQLAADPETGALNANDTPAVAISSTLQTAGGQTLLEVDEDDPMAPEYLMMRLPGEEEPEFVLVQPFVPVGGSTQNLKSLLVARNDIGHRGQLVSYTMSVQVDGPVLVASNIQTDPDIRQQFTLFSSRGSQVIQGALQPYLVANTVVYIRPVYLRASDTNALPQLVFVIAYNDDTVVRGPSVDAALDALVDAVEADSPPTTPPGDGGDGGAGPPTTQPTSPTSVPDVDPSQVEVAADALTLAIAAGAAADDAQAAGDIPEYIRLLELQQAYLARYDDLAATTSVPDTTTASTTTTTTESTAPAA